MRQNRVLEEDRDQIEMRHRTTLGKLQEAAKVVDNFERLLLVRTTVVTRDVAKIVSVGHVASIASLEDAC